jgi:hypothetical protein
MPSPGPWADEDKGQAKLSADPPYQGAVLERLDPSSAEQEITDRNASTGGVFPQRADRRNRHRDDALLVRTQTPAQVSCEEVRLPRMRKKDLLRE